MGKQTVWKTKLSSWSIQILPGCPICWLPILLLCQITAAYLPIPPIGKCRTSSSSKVWAYSKRSCALDSSWKVWGKCIVRIQELVKRIQLSNTPVEFLRWSHIFAQLKWSTINRAMCSSEWKQVSHLSHPPMQSRRRASRAFLLLARAS